MMFEPLKKNHWLLGLSWLLLAFSVWMPLSIATAQPTTTAQDSHSYVKIASWNIRIFSNSRTDDELRMICKVAKNFDFITIMELRDEQVIQRLVAMLKSEFGRTYVYDMSPPLGLPDPAKPTTTSLSREAEGRYFEYSGFLYDATFIQKIVPGKTFDDPTFFRKPYYATFRAGSFDFIALGIHVIWGDTVEGRRKEIRQLATVYRALQDANISEHDIIFMGDYNRNPDDDLAWAPLNSISSMIHLFDLPEKSMIWDTNLYDNLFFQSAYTTEFTLDRGIIRFDETDFNNDDDAARDAVSDHRPVWGLFRITGPDDD